ncbi:MAG TPA: orotidine-5'-phosphate decarboxylase [Candidatus Saccharimonadia bacterium]|nr:orotidine-5'-phosphate decarboxylase [Candidatus Saccharimonadia bacterium]
MKFSEKLKRAVERSDSLLCVGLDPGYAKLPRGVGQFAFNKAIIEATHDLVCAYKPNAAFYEAHGAEGIEALKQTCDYLRAEHPEIPIIFDAKRGDIGNTNAGYTEYVFEYLGADAVTVAPYMGAESLGKFLEWDDKGIIVLCRTSNPGAGEFQDLVVEGRPLYQHVAQQVADAWNTRGNCALVVGATYPEELQAVRAIVGAELPILVPGVGAQGGSVADAVRAGLGQDGQAAMTISTSRVVIFADDPRAAAVDLRDEINRYRKETRA